MSAIFCRLIFHNFRHEWIDKFLKLIYVTEFQTIHDLDIKKPASLDDDDSAEKSKELQFSFQLKVPHEGQRMTKAEKYQQTCAAICELTKMFEQFRRDLYSQGLADSATVTMTLLSKNIYPQHFDLQNVFSMDKLLFGSIVNRQAFAPTFVYDEPNNEKNEHEIFEAFLAEQRGLYNIELSNMLICFEHDRECFTICFPDVIPHVTDPKDGSTRSIKRVIDVKVSYAALRRTIVYLSQGEDNEIKATFTFQLNYPPTIQIYEMNDDQGNNNYKTKTKFRAPRRFLTWNPGYDIQNAISVGSCLVADCRLVDARTFLDCMDRLRKSNKCSIEFRYLHRKIHVNIRNYKPNCFLHPDTLPQKYSKLKEEKYFSLVYAVQALTTRGGELYDYFFRPEYFKFFTFLDTVIAHYDDDLRLNPDARIAKTIITLENMLLEIDKTLDVMEPIKFFQKLYAEPAHQVLAEITDDLAQEGYMRVRKIIVTPTRKVFVNPELMMGNRSLRKEGADKMLRVVFRDDNNFKVFVLPAALVKRTVTDTLLKPMNVGFIDFSYLCSSSSQLRDHGCYFLAGTADEVAEFRNSCGKFKSESIPKMMSRMGQCFTQARQLGIEIDRASYSEIFDYTGGADSNGNPYFFSEGVGMISREFCRKIVSDMKLGDCLPSCYQIRFRGYKGIVTMNTLLDSTKEWAEKHNRIPPSQKNVQLPWYCQSLIFRPSQRKFHAPREKNVEIVKMSSPVPVSLNKPLINILDQVSEMQGKAGHRRMCNRIFELLEQHLERAIASLVDTSHAFIALSEFPKYILYDNLRDFHVTEEPFFRSMLRSSALFGLHKLVDKMKIRIPISQGRMMFGVVDETGFLQHGQVFIQYTKNASLKYPGPHAGRIIHKGPVMITKNPSVVAGDVRMFDAVDIPCLHDLVDVVVFPQSGPRPHPNEMAGSDLDGDEYSIFFDHQLFLDQNEPAFDFSPSIKYEAIGREEQVNKDFTELMVQFFTRYVTQDAVGTIANAHLANSDLYGINSEHCHNIAVKHNQAVDFVKSGIIPDELTKKWDGGLPPERVEWFPNFMNKASQPSYKSNRLLSILFNRAMEVSEIIRIEEIASTDEKVKLDESVLMSGDEVYESAARTAYDEYRICIESICESYGILNEGQLFCGRFTALKKRISDKDDDNMTFFNTAHMIEEQVSTVYSKFRSKFFDDFGGIEKNTNMDLRRYNGIRETFRRVCAFPSELMRKKASAYYRVAYENGKFLSFAWLVSDILSYNRQKYLLHTGSFTFSLCPLIDYLSDHIKNLCNTHIDFNRFLHCLKKSYAANQSTTDVLPFVAKMCRHFKGLDKLLFVCRKWADIHGISSHEMGENENNNLIKPAIMDAIVVMYGMGELKKGSGGWLTVFDEGNTNINNNNGPTHIIDLEQQIGGLGKQFWSLIQFFVTQSFKFSERISMEPVVKKYLEPSQCLALYYAAEETFYPIAVNRRFDCLPGISKDCTVFQKITEGDTFIVEVPRSSQNYKTLCEKLAYKCGCKYLVLRKKLGRMNAKSFRVSLKPVGTLTAVRKFRNLLDVAPCSKELDLQKRSDMIAEETYKRLHFYTKDGCSIDDIFVP